MEEKTIRKEGERIPIKMIYDGYHEWLRGQEEVRIEEKYDIRVTTSKMRTELKRTQEIKQAKVKGKNMKCVINIGWREKEQCMPEKQDKEVEKELEGVEEYMKDHIIETDDKKDRIPIKEIVVEYNKWQRKQERHKRYGEDTWTRKARALGYYINTAKVKTKNHGEICLPCIMKVKRNEELKEK